VARKKKEKKRKTAQSRPITIQPQIHPTQETKSAARISLILTIIGVALGLLSLVTWVELFPRLSATPTAPFEVGNQFASFQVSNEGYLRITDLRFACFLWSAKIRAIEFKGVFSNIGEVPQLGVGDAATIDCKAIVNEPPQVITELDMAIVASYRPWPWPFSILRRRKVFRFTAKPGNGQMNWYKQPPDDLMAALDAAIQQSNERHPGWLL
jgi:hypothetical protein